ncbi:hypothetical protein TSAR_000966 [Trichomalopsis sarcophagae]|uniref:Uncharacterized protein n=1 Tax=Trichomalopsis sarcophagae TaxID=543379 RepID=A0A232F025_9HYME|nr:hypothetical protein TSAR_000966 [Trichomalopsis sarcophagae]
MIRRSKIAAIPCSKLRILGTHLCPGQLVVSVDWTTTGTPPNSPDHRVNKARSTEASTFFW